MKTNTPNRFSETTHEGARAARTNAEQQLRRSLMSCLLWEREFYEDGEDIAARIASLVPEVAPQKVAAMAVEAREKMKLRHAPLWVVRAMARHESHKPFVADTLATVIQRADELAEFVALYWQDGKQPLSAQVKKGLSRAFVKFNAYQLAKYNRDGAVKLRDVLFLCHAKPKDKEQEATWKQLIDDTLPIPNTWETRLSAGEDKKTAWEDLLKEKQIGALALLRNLRNMQQVDVNESLIVSALEEIRTERVLPYRFISAARYAPQLEDKLEDAMLKCLTEREKLPGKTVLLIDVSGSMDDKLSDRSDLTRIDAACGLAILARELCESVNIYTFSMELKEIPARHGFALRDAIENSQEHNGTPLGLAIESVYAPKDRLVNKVKEYGWNGYSVNYPGQAQKPDRLIVITDEQSADKISNPKIGRGYMINVASNKNGVGYGAWTHIDGWSESVLDYIEKCEKVNQ